MPRTKRICLILFTAAFIIVFASLTVAKAGQSVPFDNLPPDGNVPSTWHRQTGIAHISLPNPENNGTFPLDVNVTVLSENFVVGNPAYIIVNITIPDRMVSFLNVGLINFWIEVVNAIQADSTEQFFMFTHLENFYFPNAPYIEGLLPYDWAAYDYIVFQDVGQIRLKLSAGLYAANNVSTTADWQQRAYIDTTVTVPAITILPYGSVYSEPPTPEKRIFNRPVNDPDNWIYVACLGGLPILDFLFYVLFDLYRKTNKPTINKGVVGVIPFIISAIVVDLLYFYPYDYQLVSIQSLVVLLAWIVGMVVIYKKRKKLGRWLLSIRK